MKPKQQGGPQQAAGASVTIREAPFSVSRPHFDCSLTPSLHMGLQNTPLWAGPAGSVLPALQEEGALLQLGARSLSQIYLFRERERERAHKWEARREKERRNLKQTPHRGQSLTRASVP